MSSGNPPDVVYMSRKLVGTYAAKGAIVPLDECIKDNQIDTGQYREAALKEVTVDGRVFGIPEFYTITVNLINKKALKSAGLQPEGHPDRRLGEPNGSHVRASAVAVLRRTSPSPRSRSSTRWCG